MIAFLQGILRDKVPNLCTILVGGVGYDCCEGSFACAWRTIKNE